MESIVGSNQLNTRENICAKNLFLTLPGQKAFPTMSICDLNSPFIIEHFKRFIGCRDNYYSKIF
jgi:hypothetical protein